MIHTGDAFTVLKTLPKQSINTVITSPPYWGLRDYGIEGQLGLEHTPQEYVENLVEIFRAVREVLRDDGTVWLNLGDTYAAKDLVGIPWRVAFALQDDGWFLRSDIIWNKANPMPESVRDRPTKSHEYLFLLSKKPKYYYDAEAIKEPAEWERWGAQTNDKYTGTTTQTNWMPRREKAEFEGRNTRNKRSVWTIPTKPFKGAHFSTFPPKLVEPCVLAGSPLGGMVLDPFSGSGTTGVVALQHGREYIGVELNPEYVAMSQARLERTVNGSTNTQSL